VGYVGDRGLGYEVALAQANAADPAATVRLFFE
jgi:hypothetical protein